MRLEWANVAVTQDRFEDAITEYEAILALDTNHPEATAGLNDARTQIERRDAVRRNVVALVTEAEKFTGAEDYDQAIQRYEEALELDASNGPATEGLSQAVALKETAARIASLLEQGQEALAGRDFDAALSAFDAVLALAPENADATGGRITAVLGQQILGSRRPPP